MDYKHSCVIDAQNLYKTLVLVLRVKTDKGEEWQVQSYVLQEGEQLVDIAPPTMRPYAGAEGFVSPKWDTDTSSWAEAATPEEITAWEMEHPAPKMPMLPPTNEELAAENKLLHEQVAALSDQNDFQEELIVELANIVYA